MTRRLRSTAAFTLALLGLAMMMSMCLPCQARPAGHSKVRPVGRAGDASGIRALLRAAQSANSRDAGTFWLRMEETMTVHEDGTTREDYHNTGRILSD